MSTAEEIQGVRDQIEEVAARIKSLSLSFANARCIAAEYEKRLFSKLVAQLNDSQVPADLPEGEAQVPALSQDWNRFLQNPWAAEQASLSKQLSLGQLDRIRIGTFVELPGALDCKGSNLHSVVHQQGAVSSSYAATAPFMLGPVAIVIRHDSKTEQEAKSLASSLVLRIALALPHNSTFTFLDPIGHGQSFRMCQNLKSTNGVEADVSNGLRAVVERMKHINMEVVGLDGSFVLMDETRLSREHFEFIFVADYPTGFDRRSVEHVHALCRGGANAGKHLVVLHNSDVTPNGFENDDALHSPFVIDLRSSCKGMPENFRFDPDCPPSPNDQRALYERIGDSAPERTSLDWEDHFNLPTSEWWTEDASRCLRAPIGRGNKELELLFGVNKENEPCVHGIMAGQPGSGKSNLYHILILSLATRYSPDELGLYLVDGKRGVVFAPYVSLPHAKVVALNSPAELSRNVLDELIRKMEERYDLFRQENVEDLAEYRKEMSSQRRSVDRLPRLLLLVDEFKELWEDDSGEEASSKILKIAEQGRAAGIHMLLGGHNFKPSGMIKADEILGSFHLRVALAFADPIGEGQAGGFGREGCRLIPTGNNIVGKVLLNACNGQNGHNVTGSIAKYSKDVRDKQIAGFRDKAETLRRKAIQPIVFQCAEKQQLNDDNLFGDIRSDVTWRTSAQRLELFGRSEHEGGFGVTNVADYSGYEIAGFFGRSLAVHGRADIVLRPNPNENVLLVGGDQAERSNCLTAMVLTMASLSPPSQIRFVFAGPLDRGASSKLKEIESRFLRLAGFEVESGFGEDAKSVIESVFAEFESNTSTDLHSQRVVVVVAAPHLIPGFEDIGSVQNKLKQLLDRGPHNFVNTILEIPDSTQLKKVIGFRLGELKLFEHRIALQMSETDSHDLGFKGAACKLESNHPGITYGLSKCMSNGLPAKKFFPYQSIDRDELESIAVELAQRSESVE